MTLAELQARFYAAVVEGQTEATEWVRADARWSPQARVELYGRMYLYRLVEALRADFPCTVRLFGDGPFFQLATRYAETFPSEHPDLGQFGRAFAGYLREARASLPRPDAPELAALEWARQEVWTEADAPPVTAAELEALVERFAELRLDFVPSLRRLRAEWAVADLWRALDQQAPPPAPRAEAEALCVWRSGFDPVHCTLPAGEAEALARAHAGRPLAEVVEAFAHQAQPEQAAFEALASWFNEGWVRAVLE